MSTAPASALVWPLLAQVGWTFFLYAWLTIARLVAVRRGEASFSAFVLGREEPLAIARVTRNLANQFELPTILYALCVLLIATGTVTWLDVIAAWCFVAGRLVHTAVQTLGDDVPLRGRVFMINFIALSVIVGHVGWIALRGGFG